MESTFSLFPRLPPELRARIWELTVEPRTVPVSCWIGPQPADEVSTKGKWRRALRLELSREEAREKYLGTSLPLVLYAASPIKPGILDACRESRALGLKLYEKLILEPSEGTASYAWVNFDMDTIDIGEEQIYERFRQCGHKIRRLKFKADISCEYWCYQRENFLGVFANLRECLIMTNDNIYDWGSEDDTYRPSCSPEVVSVMNEQTREVQTLAFLDQCEREFQKQNRLELGWDSS